MIGALVSLWLRIAPSDYAESYPFLFAGWSSFSVQTLGILAVMAVLIVGVSIGLAKAYQSPRPQVIATFDYAYLIFAAFWGFVFFRETPQLWTMIGIALIIVAGVLVVIAGNGAAEPKLDKLPESGI